MALALCLTLLPAPAWAAEADAPEGDAAQIGDTVYSTLPDAVNAAKDGDTIKLLADYKTVKSAGEEEDDGLTITKSVTLDLNGYKMDDFRVAQVDEETNEVLTSGNLTVEDTSKEKSGTVSGMIELVVGKLTINGGTIGDGRDGVSIENGNLTVNGGAIDFLYSGAGSGTVTITGGTVKNARFGEGFEITVAGGSGHTGLWDVSEGTWNISGGAFEGVTFLTGSSAENLHITGGTFGKITRKILRDSIEALAPISGLLADGYAFYQKTDSEEYDQCVKLTDAIAYLENVQVKGHTHSFVNGVCAVCDYACLHTNMNGDGFCSDCQTQMAVKITASDNTVTYGTDFKAAMKAATDGTKITLLADVSIANRTGISGNDTTVTLDLNGHKITSGYLDIGSYDSPTSCTLKIIGKGSYEPPMYGGIITVNVKATLDLSEWEGGTISEINISDDSNVEKDNPSAREAAVIVGPKAGTIGKLAFGNNQLGELKKTKLSGGSFNEIWAANHQPVKLGDLLAEGYAYQNADGSYVEYGTTLQNASIYNVKVVKCLHPNMKPDAATGIATCEYCGKSGEFVASVDGNLYTDMDEAVAYWLKNGGTLKLYADYIAADGTWKVGSGSHTINLNGHRMSVKGDGAFFKPTNNMHLTVTDGTKLGQITNILLDGDQRGSFTLENGYVGNLKMTGGAVVTLKGGSVDKLDVQNCSANTNLSIQGGSIGQLNITDWADGMHVSATGGSLGAYTLPSGKILADVLDHQYYAEGTSLDRYVDTAQRTEKFVIKQAPHDIGSASKAANVPINGSIPFRVDSPSENVGVYDVKWYRRTNSGAEHMVENKVADVNVNDRLDVFCVITGLDRPNNGTVLWQVAVKDYTINVVPAKLNGDQTVITQKPNTGNTGNPADNRLVVTPLSSNGFIDVEYQFEVTYNRQPLELNKDYTIKGSSNLAKNAGTHTLTIEGMGNYTGKKSVTWTLEPYELSVENFRHTQINKEYDGTDAVTDSTNGIDGLGSFIPDSENPRNPGLLTGDNFYLRESDYQLSNMKFDSAEAGDRTFTGTMTLKSGGNFVFAGGSRVRQIEYGSVSGKQFVFISRAIIAAPAAKALQVANNHAATYTVDLSALLPKLESPRTYGEIEYSQPTVQLASGYYTVGNAKVENGKLILTIDKNPVTTTGPIGTVTVQVTTTNYTPVTLTVNLQAVNKRRLGMFVSVATDPVVYGMTLGDIKLSADATVDGQVIPGTIAWDDPLTTVPAAGQATYRWTFTPDDTMHYLTASNTITFLVDKATPTGAPTYTAITTGGKTLADATLTPNASWPSGTVQWVDKDGKPLPASTQVQANTEYTWSFTPADTANYNGATGSVTLYAVSSGGGSSSASKTTTTTNADGSVTKTETKKDGTVVETTTGKDGSVSKTETKPDGSSVTENKAADGSTGTVKTDKNGQTTAETALSSKAIEDAKKSGEAVKAPVEVEASRNSDTAPTVKIELPRNSGDTKVEIPVSNVKPGTVAVLVHPDGTEEIVKNSLPTEDGIQLTINGGATVKIVDNSKDFADTRNHWAKDAIDFVSARGLVNGMSATIYAPNASTTRAQLWTILARQNDADLTGGATWFENAQNWAKAKGISDGANPNGTINRAQMVTMLWRAVGQPVAGSTANFADVSADAYYASAVAWAVENGITTGVGNGKFDPNATCTRGQIATFLWRAMAE